MASQQKPKRGISGDLFPRQPEDWVRESKREPSPEPLPRGGMSNMGPGMGTQRIGSYPKKINYKFFGREPSPEQ